MILWRKNHSFLFPLLSKEKEKRKTTALTYCVDANQSIVVPAFE